MSLLRLLYVGWLFNLKNLTLSGFFIIVSVISPVIFASMAFLMFRFLRAAGIAAVRRDRRRDDGHLVVDALRLRRIQAALAGDARVLDRGAAAFIWVVLPLTIATATIGLYSLTSTLLWAGSSSTSRSSWPTPGWFIVAVPIAVLSLGLLGLVLAATFVLYRHANALGNLLEYPIWLVTGLLTGLRPAARLDAPDLVGAGADLGREGPRESAIGGDPGFAILMSVGLGLIYLVIGHFCLQYFERLAREKATLALT